MLWWAYTIGSYSNSYGKRAIFGSIAGTAQGLVSILILPQNSMLKLVGQIWAFGAVTGTLHLQMEQGTCP